MKHENVIGIDLSDTTLDVVLLSFANDTHVVEKQYSVVVPTGLVVNGVLSDVASVVTFIKEQCQTAGISFTEKIPCAWVVPQCITYTHVYTHTNKDEPTLSREAMVQAAVKLAPVSSDNTAVSYLHPQDDLDIVVVSAKKVVEQWQACATAVSDAKCSFFLEGYSALLGLDMPKENGPYVIVDIGGRSTVVTAVVESHVRGLFVSPIAGMYMTQEIARAQDCDVATAEEMKRTKGIGSKSPIATTIKPVADLLATRIRSAIDFLEKKYAISFQSAVYIGGTLQMKGLQTLLEKQIGLVQMDGVPTHESSLICAVGAARAYSEETQYAIFADLYTKPARFSLINRAPKEVVAVADVGEKQVVSDVSPHHIFAWRMIVIALGCVVVCAIGVVVWLFLYS
jgi:Tfp pilus assembly PilM family ATPase